MNASNGAGADDGLASMPRFYFLELDWDSVPICEECETLDPSLRMAIDNYLDRCCIGQMLQRDTVAEIGKALAASMEPPSFFSKEGERANAMVHTGINWRLDYSTKRRHEEFRMRAIERAPILGKTIAEALEGMPKPFSLPDASLNCRFCGLPFSR